MSNINNQSNDLDALDTVQDLSNESAAAIKGGTSEPKLLNLFDHAAYQGQKLMTFSADLPNLASMFNGVFNDKFTSIKNNSDYTWEFFTDINYQGSSFHVNPGQKIRYLGCLFNNKISSFRRVLS